MVILVALPSRTALRMIQKFGMARRVVDRPPAALSFVAPASWWLPGSLLGAVDGGVLPVLGGAGWLLPLTTVGGTAVAEAHWRRTRPPSADPPWTPVARMLFRRRPPTRGPAP
jgi:hypothetical protein